MVLDGRKCGQMICLGEVVRLVVIVKNKVGTVE